MSGALRTVLAVDGGNSKTDVALVAEDGTVLGRARGGPFTPQASGPAAAVRVIADAAAGLGPPADHVSAYLAGADFPVEEDALAAEIAARGLGRSVTVGNDTFALLRAGTPEPYGVAVVCGAGVNCVGVAPDGRVARFPAIGPLSGDWGGGGELSRAALWHAVRAEDGRGPETALREAVAAHFGTPTVEAASLAFHFGDYPAGRMHELVPLLFRVAAAGDGVAHAVVDRQAEEIALLGTVALRRLDLLGAPVPVVLGGGVLTARDPLLMGLVARRYAAAAPMAVLSVTGADPIAGAALLGLERLGAGPAALARARDALA